MPLVQLAENAPGAQPGMVMFVIVNVELPVFVMVKTALAVLPTSTFPNESGPPLMEMMRVGATPAGRTPRADIAIVLAPLV